MALVYFDSSALVKLVVEENGSELAASLWDGCDTALSSRLTSPEVCAALAAARRNDDLSESELATVLRDWRRFWAAVRPVELTAGVERRAGDLARRHSPRGADAVHLASALAVSSADVVVAVWDRRLHRAAVQERLAVAPARLT